MNTLAYLKSLGGDSSPLWTVKHSEEFDTGDIQLDVENVWGLGTYQVGGFQTPLLTIAVISDGIQTGETSASKDETTLNDVYYTVSVDGNNHFRLVKKEVGLNANGEIESNETELQITTINKLGV